MSLTDEQIEQGQRYLSVWRHVTSRPMASHVVGFARAIEAPLVERIAEMEEMNAQLREQNTAVDKACADLEAHIEQLERELKAERAVSFRDQVAQLEQRNRDLWEDVQRFRAHALNEKEARMALERELEAVRKDAERWAMLRYESKRVNPVCKLLWKNNSDRSSNRWVNVVDYDEQIDAAKEKP
jgi:predicted RNase H-like nuclease (RuvC/YqgF family)